MMEAILDDLAHDPVVLSSPEWHSQALSEAEQAHAEHQVDFVSWDVAKKILCDTQERDQLRSLLLQGAQSASSGFADEAYFTALRSSINPVV